MITADQLVAHAVGDYLLQSHWMANEKTRDSRAAGAHAVCYSVPFAFLTDSWVAVAVIIGTHFLVDRYRLARHVVWAKNWWFDFSNGWRFPPITPTGYPLDAPPWLAVWLLIIADNVIHVLINGAALRWL